MPSGPRQDGSATPNNLQQLAHELVACLGRDSAIHVCKINGWQGILDAIMAEEAPEHKAGGH